MSTSFEAQLRFEKCGFRRISCLAIGSLALASCAFGERLNAGYPDNNHTATIQIDTAHSTPIQHGFSGVNDNIGFPVEYWDHRFNELAEDVHYGWVRFPGGTCGDCFDWRTGEEIQDWFLQFAGNRAGPGADLVKDVFGKGGSRMIDAARRASELGCPLLVCANAFTDTPESIGRMAAYAKAHHIPVAAWELANEAYDFPSFFPNSTVYLDKMRCFRDAIKAVDPDAIVAIFARDPSSGSTLNPWDRGIGTYPDQYWDAVTYHSYPPPSTGGFDQWMADETGVLATKTTTLVTDLLAPINPPGTRFMITEFDPSLPVDGSTGIASLTDGTLWGGIYAAEYIMRMSTVPSVAYVGAHSIVNVSGVASTNNNYPAVLAAAASGNPIDTATLDFGFYLDAQANALSVLNGVINHAIRVNHTSVSGGETVAATGAPGGKAPALFAMSYSGDDREMSVVITNKSASPHRVSILVNGRAAHGRHRVEFVSGAVPSLANTPGHTHDVTVQWDWCDDDVTVPPYSVMRVDLQHDSDDH